MIKKLALLAAAGLLYVAAPATSASAQGISVRVGGPGYHHHHRGWDRGPGWHRSRAYYAPRHHGWGPRHGGRTKIIVR
jgi:hypothetical protein